MGDRFGSNDSLYDLTRILSMASSQAAISGTATGGILPSDIALTDAHILVGNASNVGADVAMSGDATIANTGALTLATVNADVGTFGSATQVAQVTANAKGLITAIANVTITGASPVGAALTRGSIWRGGATNLAEAYALGAANKVLQSDGTDAIWSNFTLTISGNSTINGSLTGGGSLVTGGFTLTVPATGTAALLQVANIFTVGPQTINTGADVNKGLIVKAHSATQSANLQEWQNSAGSVMNVIKADGKVGIGVLSPTYRLSVLESVNGVGAFEYKNESTGTAALAEMRVSSADAAFALGVNATTSSAPLIYTAGEIFLDANFYATGLTFSAVSSVPISFRTGGRTSDKTRLYIAGDGKIGIGTISPSTLIHSVLDNATTNAVDTLLTIGHNSAGIAAAGFGGAIALNLESSTTADQAAAAIKWLWTDATHATKTSRADIETTGPGKCAAWGYNGIDGTARTIIANGTGDVTEGITVQYVASEVTGTDSFGGVAYLEPGDSFVINTDATNVLTLACAADGSVTVQRTAGSTETYKFQCWAVWV